MSKRANWLWAVIVGVFMALLLFLDFKTDSNIASASGGSAKKVSSFTELYSETYKDGTVVETTCYAKEGDGGAARYLINRDPGEGSVVDMPLDNGFYAHLQYKDSVNVAALGILPGAECSIKLNSAIDYLSGKTKKLKFNAGTYYIANRIYLKSIVLEGRNTVFSVSTDFDHYAHRIFLTDLNRHDVKYDITITGITFLYEDTKDQFSHGQGITLLTLTDINSCKIKNCSFIARNIASNGEFLSCNLLWFENTSSKDITIDSCNFQNLTGCIKDNASKEHLVGGCIWFSGTGQETNFSNVKINKCNIEHTTSDEAIAVWDCSVSNFLLSNSTIKNTHYYSKNVLSVYGAATDNFVVKKCGFLVEAPAFTVAKIYNMAGSSKIDFLDCDFDMNTESFGQQMVSFIYTNDNGNKEMNETNKTVMLDGCRFRIKGNEKFTYVVSLYGAQHYKYIARNCNVKNAYNRAFFSVAYTDNCEVEISNIPIKTENPSEVVERFENSQLSIQNN